MHHILKTKNGKCRLEKVKKILECRKGNGKEEPEELKARRIGEIRMCVEKTRKRRKRVRTLAEETQQDDTVAEEVDEEREGAEEEEVAAALSPSLLGHKLTNLKREREREIVFK
jgi:hypothetical protein